MPETVHDVKISRIRKYGCARVENVPPEEFGISRRQRSVMLRDCDYCYHEVRKTEAELLAAGYDKEQVKALPDYAGDGGAEEIARDTVDDNALSGSEGLNKANRQIRVTEHYVICVPASNPDGPLAEYLVDEVEAYPAPDPAGRTRFSEGEPCPYGRLRS